MMTVTPRAVDRHLGFHEANRVIQVTQFLFSTKSLIFFMHRAGE